MKKLLTLTIVLIVTALVLVVSNTAMAQCTTIKDGTLTYSAGHYLAGQPLKTGYDIFGYNYQAHLFNGSYANVYLGRGGLPPYEGDDAAYLEQYGQTTYDAASSTWMWPWRDVTLTMKWNDAWLSNKDCDGDDLLDRYYGHSSYSGSGAWETNHMSGSYEVVVNGKTKKAHWTYFVKIVAAPSDANVVDGIWYDADGVEIGPVEWGAFAIIQQVENDPFAGIHGKQYGSPAGPGFGQYGPE